MMLMNGTQKEFYVSKLYKAVSLRYNLYGPPLNEYSDKEFVSLREDMERQLGVGVGVSLRAFKRYLNESQIPSNGKLNVMASYVYKYDNAKDDAWRTFVNDLKDKPEHLEKKNSKTLVPSHNTYAVLVLPFTILEEETYKKQYPDKAIKIRLDEFKHYNGWDFDVLSPTKILANERLDQYLSIDKIKQIGERHHADLVIWGELHIEHIRIKYLMITPNEEQFNPFQFPISPLKTVAELSEGYLQNDIDSIICTTIALRAYEEERYDVALSSLLFLKNNLKKEDSHTDFRLGVIYGLNEDSENARKHYQSILKNTELVHEPVYFKSLLNMGNLLLEDGEYKSAITVYEKLIGSSFEYQANNNLGVLYYLTNQQELAIEYFTQACKHLKSYEAYSNRSYMYRKINNHEKALQDAMSAYTQLSRSGADTETNLHDLAITYFFCELSEEGILCFEELIKLSPSNLEYKQQYIYFLLKIDDHTRLQNFINHENISTQKRLEEIVKQYKNIN